jgi:hypothetical protein
MKTLAALAPARVAIDASASLVRLLSAARLEAVRSGREVPIATKTKAWTVDLISKMHPTVVVISRMRKETSPTAARAQANLIHPFM